MTRTAEDIQREINDIYASWGGADEIPDDVKREIDRLRAASTDGARGERGTEHSSAIPQSFELTLYFKGGAVVTLDHLTEWTDDGETLKWTCSKDAVVRLVSFERSELVCVTCSLCESS